MEEIKWIPYDKGSSIGKSGSENGIILMDEEYQESCRITLERTEKGYAITCGVYGSMVHTAFADEKNHLATYRAMKSDLAEFIDSESDKQEEYAFYDTFTSKY